MHHIGFCKTGDNYEIVADWWGIKGIKKTDFQQKVTQRYAYQVATTKLAEQGFNLITEDTQKDGRIHLVMRRVT